MKKDFYHVRINTLRAGSVAPFDIFIPVGDRYVHYMRNQDELEGQRLKGLKAKGVKKLYIRVEDEPAYLSYLEQGLDTLMNKDVSLEERAGMAHETMVTSAENAEKNLETESGYIAQKKQLEQISNFIGAERGPIKSMLNASGVSLDNNQHSATVSSLCLAVAKKLGQQTSEEITELGFAALLHDFGKSRLKFDANLPMSKLTPEQVKQYKNHPADGAAMLAGKPFISPRILGLIASHEEYGEGRGFPEKKDISKLDISYQILSLVNRFDNYCQDHALAATAAIDPFYEENSAFYSEELIQVLATILT